MFTHSSQLAKQYNEWVSNTPEREAAEREKAERRIRDEMDKRLRDMGWGHEMDLLDERPGPRRPNPIWAHVQFKYLHDPLPRKEWDDVRPTLEKYFAKKRDQRCMDAIIERLSWVLTAVDRIAAEYRLTHHVHPSSLELVLMESVQ
jgi:hypothetical protein